MAANFRRYRLRVCPYHFSGRAHPFVAEWLRLATGQDREIGLGHYRIGTGYTRVSLVGYYLHMRILIASDRHWRCNDLAKQIINRLLARYGADLVIVHRWRTGS